MLSGLGKEPKDIRRLSKRLFVVASTLCSLMSLIGIGVVFYFGKNEHFQAGGAIFMMALLPIMMLLVWLPNLDAIYEYGERRKQQAMLRYPEISKLENPSFYFACSSAFVLVWAFAVYSLVSHIW